MAQLSFSEKLRITAITVERRRRALLSRALGLPGVRLRYGARRIDQLLIVPPDLRQSDPSFWYEIQHGHFGLAGTVVVVDDASPFDVPPPNRPWVRSLHGFSWLRHLAAAGDAEAGDTARQLALEWIMRYGVEHHGTVAWNPDIVARRIISWITQSSILLEGADERGYDTITRSLGAQLVYLSSAWREAPAGYPRLLATTALLLADLSISGRDSRIDADLQLFNSTLSRQILSDGGHVSRNARLLVDVLLDVLPLKECFRARGRPQPQDLAKAIAAMIDMLRAQRLGDGLLARFNGVGVAQQSSLATVLAYGDFVGPPPENPPAWTGPSGYVRIARNGTVVFADCGAAPPLEMAGEAQAGCLSFELCSGDTLIVSNGGMPGATHADWIAAARSTASHNALVLGETSSSRLVASASLESLLGQAPIRGPDDVRSATREGADGSAIVEASHNGYLAAHGVLHHRRIALEADGRRVVGIDRLKPRSGTLRLKRDVPFSIHFHLHPGVECRLADKVGAVIIEAGDQRWRMAAEGARLGIEESIHFAATAGPLVALQVVLRGATFGETEVRWALTRID